MGGKERKRTKGVAVRGGGKGEKREGRGKRKSCWMGKGFQKGSEREEEGLLEGMERLEEKAARRKREEDIKGERGKKKGGRNEGRGSVRGLL